MYLKETKRIIIIIMLLWIDELLWNFDIMSHADAYNQLLQIHSPTFPPYNYYNYALHVTVC